MRFSRLGLFFLLCLSGSALGADSGLHFAVGISPGAVLPIGKDISHYQVGFMPRIDARVTGFTPVVGLGLNAGYTWLRGPYQDSLRRDSSRYTSHFLPVAVYLFSDFSPLVPRAPVLPYLKLGFGPCYSERRTDGKLFLTPDTTTAGDSLNSSQWDCVFQATLGAEKRLGRLPLTVFAELAADYITNSHYKKYASMEDDVYAVVSVGLRYHIR